MESSHQSSDQISVTYMEWKNKQSSQINHKSQSSKGIISMDTTAGVGGIRIHDILLARQQEQRNKAILIKAIEPPKKNSHRDVSVQTEHYDEQTEYLLQARRNQEKDNESDDHTQIVTGMWNLGFN